MNDVIKAFFRERRLYLLGLFGSAGFFWIIFYLYDVQWDAVQYAFFLAAVWLIVLGGWDFTGYYRRHRKLEDSTEKIENDAEELPVPAGILEEDYQQIVRELYEKKAELESQNRISRQEMSDYYAMWVHQIKTPISALHVLIQTSEEDRGKAECEAENRQLLREMKLELFKIEQYVEMVLTYLRMEDMSSDMAFELCSLDGIVKQAVRKYSQMFILQRIGLEYRPLDRQVLTDEKWLVFVIEQVLSNALKYTKQGHISIYMEEDVLVIEDTGIGIWPEDLPRVFERGFTGYNGRENKKSTGIGLYLCRSIMQRLRHHIWIESEPEVGTRVCMDLRRQELHVE